MSSHLSRSSLYVDPMPSLASSVHVLGLLARLLTWRLAETADEAALPFVLAWVGCLLFNPDLLETLAPLTAMGSRLPQVAWAAWGAFAAALEIYGLAERARGREHRRPRILGTLCMGIFFAWLAGELAARDWGLPAVWYFAWLAFTCLLGAGRLVHLQQLEAWAAGRRS